MQFLRIQPKESIQILVKYFKICKLNANQSIHSKVRKDFRLFQMVKFLIKLSKKMYFCNFSETNQLNRFKFSENFSQVNPVQMPCVECQSFKSIKNYEQFSIASNHEIGNQILDKSLYLQFLKI